MLIGGAIAGCVLCYRKYGERIRRVKMPKMEMGKQTTKKSSSFNIFNDEETQKTAESRTESRSTENLFGLRRTPTPQQERTKWQRFKGIFSSKK